MEPESWELGDQEFEAVRALSPTARYDHFMGRVTDWGWVWLLGDQSEMALVDDPDAGVTYMPVWPHARYADIERERGWERYEVIGLSLDDWMEKLLPTLDRDGIDVGVFPVWDAGAQVLAAEELREALRERLVADYGGD